MPGGCFDSDTTSMQMAREARSTSADRQQSFALYHSSTSSSRYTLRGGGGGGGVDDVEMLVVDNNSRDARNENLRSSWTRYHFNYLDFKNKSFRARDSELVIEWDADDTVPMDIKQTLTDSFQAVITNDDGACAIHSVFGRPNTNKELFLQESRTIASHYLTVLADNVDLDPDAQTAVSAIEASLWNEFVVPFLEKRPSIESDLFWESLERVCPDLAVEAESHFHTVRLETEQANNLKSQVRSAARQFFCANNEVYVREVARKTGYLNKEVAINVANSTVRVMSLDTRRTHPCEGTEDAVLGGFVRGSDRQILLVDAPHCKYSALFDDRPAFDALREAFLVFGDERSKATLFARTLADVGGVDTNEAFYRKVRAWNEASTDMGVPERFAVRAWAAYLDCVRKPSYWFSVDELLIICRNARVKLLVFKEVDHVLRFVCGNYFGEGEMHLTKINAEGERSVRSHFERLIPKRILAEFAQTQDQERLLEECRLRQEREAAAERAARVNANKINAESSNKDASGGDCPPPPAPHPAERPAKEIGTEEFESDKDESPPHSPVSLSDSSDEESDAEDVFGLSTASDDALPAEYKRLFLHRWGLAAKELSDTYLRSDLTLPMDPRAKDKIWTNVDDAIELPLWHCGFQGCTATSSCTAAKGCQNHESGLWQHIWSGTGHRQVLQKAITKHDLTEKNCSQEETAFTLLNQAYLLRERLACPRVGISTDRRSLSQLGEVFYEKNVETLMCFICSCKHIHHTGFDKFGRSYPKGTISYHTDVKDMFSEKTNGESWTYNLSAKRFKDTFGNAVATDPFLQDDVFEWKRKVLDKNNDEAICCPEDVEKSVKCRHDDDTVCSKCRIPICNECWRLTQSNAKIPKALANDNIIGYANAFIIAEKVTWLEATIAAPVFSGLVTYYIEGDKSDIHNLMEIPVGHAQKSWGVLDRRYRNPCLEF